MRVLSSQDQPYRSTPGQCVSLIVSNYVNVVPTNPDEREIWAS